jgi:hypothetical protein
VQYPAVRMHRQRDAHHDGARVVLTRHAWVRGR